MIHDPTGDTTARTDIGTVARRVLVSGLVQGVFFRDSCRHESVLLGVTGWVRNTSGGDVEVHAEGAPDAVAALVDWCGQGPAKAQVDQVVQEPAALEHHPQFAIR